MQVLQVFLDLAFLIMTGTSMLDMYFWCVDCIWEVVEQEAFGNGTGRVVWRNRLTGRYSYFDNTNS